MKSSDLLPTYENLLSTYANDTISRNPDLNSFVDILDSLTGPFSIAVDGSWGSGKTFFVKQSKMILDAFNPNVVAINQDDRDRIKQQWRQSSYQPKELQPQVSVYYDAWENDADEEPVLSLIYNILTELGIDYNLNSYSGFAETTTTIIDAFSGIELNKIRDRLRGTDPLQPIKDKKSIQSRINQFLDDVICERGNRLVIYVDELDRCAPTFAVKLLERIKHYFTNDKVTFVFSINSLQLQTTIRKFYGEEFDAGRYLDRFFDLRLPMPPLVRNAYFKSVDFNENATLFNEVCAIMIDKYNFSMREAGRYIRTAKVTAQASAKTDFTFPDGRARQFCFHIFVPIILGLRIIDTKLYNDFIAGKDDNPFFTVMNELDYRGYEYLLAQNETYEAIDTTKKHVTKQQKLKQLYNATFSTRYDGRNYRIDIGQYEFRASTKDYVMRVIGLSNKYLDFSDD